MRDSDLAWVYAAAASAAAGPDGARAAAKAALAEEQKREASMVTAVCVALGDDPADPFASLAPPERAPLALARLLDMSVDSIASALGREREEVKQQMAAALRRLSAYGARQRRQPPPDFGSEAFRARAGRAS